MTRNRLIGAAAVVVVTAAAVVTGLTVFDHGRSAASEIRSLRTLGYPLYCGGGKHPYVALTFDDGPTPWTPKLVHVLRENGARATFFEIGRKAAAAPRLARLEASAGEIGDHTWSHPSLTKLPNAQVVGQLVKAQQTFEALTGRRPMLYRPPFEAHDARVDGIASGLGLLAVLWNVDSGDASGISSPPSSEIARNLTERVRPGAIVLLHEDETAPRAIDALERFLPELRRRGLHTVSVSDLLRLDPPDTQELPNGSGGCNSSWRP